MVTEIKYKLADYDGGLDAHPVPEAVGQLWLVGSWWELHFKHAREFVNGELTEYVLEALPLDNRSCLISVCEPETDGEILCTFLLPDTSADGFMRDLDHSLGELEASDAEKNDESLDWSADHDRREPTDFTVRAKAVIGQQLELRASSRGYELCSGGGQRVALVGLYGASGDLVRLVCAEGSWRLNKRRKYGWELVIESADGRPIGSYSGRHWAAGGTISMADGVRADFRHNPIRAWNLRVSETRELIATLGGRKLTIHSLPVELYPQAEVVVLAACAVTLLNDSITTPASTGYAGG